jgi:predicted nucleotidyltransferase
MLYESKVKAILQQILAQNVAVKVILFGSAAKESKQVNDLDFLIVIPNALNPREVSRALQIAVRRKGMPVDFVVVTIDEFAAGSKDSSSVIFNASREGIELYVA